jgi:hypothetical protein
MSAKALNDFILVITFLSFAGTLFGQGAKEVDQEDSAGLEYALQYSENKKSMAYVVGLCDSQEDDEVISMFEFDAIYAFRQLDDGEVCERFERTGVRNFSTGLRPEVVDERVLRDRRHEWIERGGSIFDARLLNPDKNEQDSYTPVNVFDPYALPITYTNGVVATDANRNVLDLMMPHGRFFEGFTKGDGTQVGVWFHGKEKDIGLTILGFDERSGNMPTKCEIRFRKKGRPGGTLDKTEPYKTTNMYSKTETKWDQHVSGMWVPTEIESEQPNVAPQSYSLKIVWWIGDEVPDEIFTLDDLKLATLRQSKAHSLIRAKKLTKQTKQN